MPFAAIARDRGDGRTSFGPPFPGCPGLSQSRSPRIFHARGTSTVPSKNGRSVRLPFRIVTKLF